MEKRKIFTYELKSHIETLRQRIVRSEESIVLCNTKIEQFHHAIEAVKELKYPLLCMRKQYDALQTDKAKYIRLISDTRKNIDLLKNLTPTSLCLYHVVSKIGRDIYVRCDHVKLPEILYSSKNNPVVSVTLIN